MGNLRERIKEVLTGTSESIVVRIFGAELPVLREKADEITEKIADIDGVIDASPDFAEDLPHIQVQLDLARARRYGLKPGTSAARPQPCWRAKRSATSSTPARPTTCTCGAFRRRATASATWRTSRSTRPAATTFASSRSEERLEQVDMLAGYHAEVLGESTELNAAQDRLYTFGIGAAIAIFLLLQAAFGSLRLAALTFLLLPMALVGGVLAVKLGDGILSLGSLVGFLTVFGIAARSGILMISHFQHLEKEEGARHRPGARAAWRSPAASRVTRSSTRWRS